MQLREFIFFNPSPFKVILIENKEESLVRAQSRSAELGLKNIGFIQANLDYFTGPFQIGVSTASALAPILVSLCCLMIHRCVDNMATVSCVSTVEKCTLVNN